MTRVEWALQELDRALAKGSRVHQFITTAQFSRDDADALINGVRDRGLTMQTWIGADRFEYTIGHAADFAPSRPGV